MRMKLRHAMLGMLLTTAFILPHGMGEAAQAYVQEARYTSENVDLRYPEVETESYEVTDTINEALEKPLRYIQRQVWEARISKRRAGDLTHEVQAQLDYDVTYQDEDYVSVRLHGDMNTGGAHPYPYTFAYTFRLRDGEDMDLEDFRKESDAARASKYTLAAVNRALREQTAERGIPLFSDFKGLKASPRNLYLDERGHLHAVFPHYEVAPYSSGIIDIDLDA